MTLDIIKKWIKSQIQYFETEYGFDGLSSREQVVGKDMETLIAYGQWDSLRGVYYQLTGEQP